MFDCELTVTGPEDAIKRFKKKAAGETPPEIAVGALEMEPIQTCLSFHSLCPIPERLLPLRQRLDAEQRNWLQKSWGCMSAIAARITCDEPTKLVYRFRSARVPGVHCPGVPAYLLRKTSGDFCTLEFSLHFENAGNLEAGRMTVFRQKGHTNRFPAQVCSHCKQVSLACRCKAAVVVADPIPDPVLPVASGERLFTKV